MKMRKDKVMAIAMIVLLIAVVGVLAFAVVTNQNQSAGAGSTEALFENVSMYMNHVGGSQHGTIMVFGLSTCSYCHQTKALLDKLGVDYYWVDVDQSDAEAVQTIFGPSGIMAACGMPPGFPVIVADDGCIIGYNEEALIDIATR